MLIKFSFIAYIAYAAFIGTGDIYRYYALLWHNSKAPAPMPLYLPNGFIYDHDWGQRYSVDIIKDQNENIIIMADVKDVMLYEDTIYGFRQGLAKEPYYYICTYADDCSKTQHLKEIDFIRMLKEKGLPEYISQIAQTYDQLLLEQSKTDIRKKAGDSIVLLLGL